MEKDKKTFTCPLIDFFFSTADIMTVSISKEEVLDPGDGLGEEI